MTELPITQYGSLKCTTQVLSVIQVFEKCLRENSFYEGETIFLAGFSYNFGRDPCENKNYVCTYFHLFSGRLPI